MQCKELLYVFVLRIETNVFPEVFSLTLNVPQCDLRVPRV